MTGLKENWQTLPKHFFCCRTTSASGEEKDETIEGILLCEAADTPVFRKCTVRCADGVSSVFSRKDAENACLALRGGLLNLCFFRDSNRRRWLKEPILFIFE